MVLAADLMDKRGRVLIPAGKELVEKYVNALPAWGVTQLEVEGDEALDTGVEVEPWALEAAEKQIDELFSKTNRAHPAIEQLVLAVVRRKAHLIQMSVPAGDAA